MVVNTRVSPSRASRTERAMDRRRIGYRGPYCQVGDLSPDAAYPADVGIVRSWLRGILGASGVTLLVPLGLLAAVLVATTVGGSGLGAVGQLIGGPEVPGVRAEVPSREREL